MMNTRNLYYAKLYVTTGMRLLNRNRLLSVVMTVVVSLLLFALYAMVCASAHTAKAAAKVDDQLVVTAIVKQDPKTRKSIVPASALAVQVKQIAHVEGVHVVSETETRARFLRNFKDLKTAPAAWVFNEALEIRVTDTSEMKQVQAAVSKLNGIERATYLEHLVTKLTAVSGYLRTSALAAALLLGFIAVLIVMAVVRAAMDSEKRSVATMASVGGSLHSILGPLLVHLLSVTVLASLLACLAGWWVDPQISSAFGNAKNLPDWLQTGRAYGLLTLWPAFAAAASAVVATIVTWGCWRYSRSAIG